MLEREAPLEGAEHGSGQELYSDDVDWLAIAQEAYRSSTDYLDETYRQQFEKNLANFRSKHPKGSKYYTENYKFRSRLFRPKTRASIRRSEASFSEAMFATTDVINLEPIDQASPVDEQTTILWQAVLNYRLGRPAGGKHSIPWFLTAVGAFQESKIYGIVCSRQDWEREEVDGRVLTDRPRVELLEIENVRFAPGAKWYDPVGTSPYFIELIPMYVSDVMDMIKSAGWNEMTRGEILSYGRNSETSTETTRIAREDDKNDPLGTQKLH
jgi:hypothetical protein